jgi:hypothetical protein
MEYSILGLRNILAYFHRRIKEAANASGMSLAAWVVAACLDRLRQEARRF